jgi:hypothetical protein
MNQENEIFFFKCYYIFLIVGLTNRFNSYMKKILSFILSAFLLASSFNVLSQPSKSTWLTGNIGLNSTWILNQNAYGNQEMEYSTKFGLTGSIGLNYYLNNEYGLSFGVGIGNYGQSYGGEQEGAKASRKVNLNYIEVPIFVMKQLGDPKNPCWFTLGPQIMILSSAKQKYSRDGGAVELPSGENLLKVGKYDVTKWYKPLDVMLNAGITNIYYMGTSDNVRFRLSFNAALGLLDINSNDPKYHVVRSNNTYKGSHNFYLGVQVGLMFNQ